MAEDCELTDLVHWLAACDGMFGTDVGVVVVSGFPEAAHGSASVAARFEFERHAPIGRGRRWLAGIG